MDNLETLSCIKENAHGLLLDAELMFENRRWSRAQALAILAIEEIGKYLLLKWNMNEPKLLLSHRKKQQTATTLSFARIAEEVLSRYLSENGLALKHRSELSDDQKKFLESEEGQACRELIFGPRNNALVERVSEKVDEDGFSEKVSTGVMDQAKQRALYVDIGRNGNVLNTPSGVTEDDAEQWLIYARNVVSCV